MKTQTIHPFRIPAAASRTSLAALTGVGLALASPAAVTQAYVVEAVNGHTVRCSTIRSDTLSEDVLSRYLLEPSRSTGVLSCVVQPSALERGDTENFEAELSAQAITLTGVPVPLEFREVLEDDQITYLATYAIPVDGPLNFEISALVPAATEATVIAFEDIHPQEPF